MNSKKTGAFDEIPLLFGKTPVLLNASGRSVPLKEWNRLSAESRDQIEQFESVLFAFKQGDFNVRFDSPKDGILSRAAELLNDILGLNEHLIAELVRVGTVVGREGKIYERASVGPAKGAWATAMTSVNQLIADLVSPTNEVARVITAVARGDFSEKMLIEFEGRPLRGEFLRIGTTVNGMVDGLNSFAAEVTRVAKEDMISSSMRTDQLLQQLRTSNAELEAQAGKLNEKAKLLEVKNNEVELASRSLEEKAKQLQLISKYKSEFLANMSHELRTPMNSLLILSKLLAENKDGNLTEEQLQFARTVYTSGNDLLALINEILDLSKVEAGKMPVDPADVRLRGVSDYLEQTFRHVAAQRNLSFNIQLDPGLPQTVFTDVNRLQQILKNLLSNALKFTDAGKVSLAIRPAPERGGSTLAFAVHDTGIGIAAEKQKLIFEAFQQADGTISGKYGGTGLGLTISREIAHLLGGSIEVVSAPDKGSTFTLLLPTTYAGADLAWRNNFITNHQKFESKIPPLPENATFAGAKVLLVDDDARNLYALRTVLEARGITVRHAENGRIALEVLHSEPEIELVLMDTMMPEMDGLAATRAIREIKQFQSLPIISLTARAMKDDCEKAFAAGATDYVAKPVDPEKLLAVVHFWCRNGDRTPLAASSTVEVAQ